MTGRKGSTTGGCRMQKTGMGGVACMKKQNPHDPCRAGPRQRKGSPRAAGGTSGVRARKPSEGGECRAGWRRAMAGAYRRGMRQLGGRAGGRAASQVAEAHPRGPSGTSAHGSWCFRCFHSLSGDAAAAAEFCPVALPLPFQVRCCHSPARLILIPLGLLFIPLSAPVGTPHFCCTRPPALPSVPALCRDPPFHVSRTELRSREGTVRDRLLADS